MGKHKEKHKKQNKEKREKKQRAHSSSSEDEWVEKSKLRSSEAEQSKNESKREEWMSLSTSFTSRTHLDRRKEREENKKLEKERSIYNPGECSRELNPYWKHGGDGLPGLDKFKKPNDTDFNYRNNRPSAGSSSNWRKKSTSASSELTNDDRSERKHIETIPKDEVTQYTEKELNALAAKLVKAEIMGNTTLITKLKDELENARKACTKTQVVEDVILTMTDSRGYSRPVQTQSEYGESSGSRRKKQKVETHRDGQRTRYFADDDKYSLNQMFENEKFNSVADQNSQFIKLAGKVRKNDDLDDIFTDEIRKMEPDEKTHRKNTDRAIGEHQRTSQSLDNCKWCLQSERMSKNLMVSFGETIYLSLPHFEPLTDGHCLIVSLRHVPCATQLDENEWAEIITFRKALCKMFGAQNQDVIFFETVISLNKFPHMFMECVPLPKEEGDLAPIYFKKAIDESEREWASNKKLISLAGRDVRKAVPKGLPYFSVSFGMDEGYAHVIEDHRYFPANFAQEIIGGMLDLDHSKWRKPKSLSFTEQSNRVLEFSKMWCDYDCTK